jgi:hypothetical protein
MKSRGGPGPSYWIRLGIKLKVGDALDSTHAVTTRPRPSHLMVLVHDPRSRNIKTYNSSSKFQSQDALETAHATTDHHHHHVQHHQTIIIISTHGSESTVGPQSIHVHILLVYFH